VLRWNDQSGSRKYVVLTGTQRQQVEAYLDGKYAIY
jgi:hypothetical protein